MLRSVKDLTSYPVSATDGPLGSVKDALFDDRFWTLRYLVVDTGKWLPGRKVLVSPLHLRQPEIGLPKHSFPVDLTKQQIKDCPELHEDAPVSRKYEEEYARYYNHDLYWIGPHAYDSAGMGLAAASAAVASTNEAADQIRHIRRVREIENT
ncbi:MAG: PRC-barrel domain containing protein, partial [Verrucomicrobiae bacterium]|nr:PRC-barrel domain containing protein [Verrucomicrobiae bacterium]